MQALLLPDFSKATCYSTSFSISVLQNVLRVLVAGNSKSPDAWLGGNLSSIRRHLENMCIVSGDFHCVLAVRLQLSLPPPGKPLLEERISLTFRCQGAEAQVSRPLISHSYECNAFEDLTV